MTFPVFWEQVVVIVQVNREILEECFFQSLADCGVVLVEQCSCFIPTSVIADIMEIVMWDFMFVHNQSNVSGDVLEVTIEVIA